MESRQRHFILLTFIILSINHVVCQNTQCGGCGCIRNCNSNCERGKLRLTMNVPFNDGSCNCNNECQCSSLQPCGDSCSCSVPSCTCQAKQPVTKLFLLPNQQCSPCAPSVSCSPTFSTRSTCCPSLSNFCCERSLPSVILPPQIPLPKPLCLQTSFPLPNVGIVQPDPNIAQCDDADFEGMISECWNNIPCLPNCNACANNCQTPVPVVLQLVPQQAECTYPQIIVQKSSSKLRKLLPILMIAMMAGDNNNNGCSCCGNTVIPVPIPIPIPYSNYATGGS